MNDRLKGGFFTVLLLAGLSGCGDSKQPQPTVNADAARQEANDAKGNRKGKPPIPADAGAGGGNKASMGGPPGGFKQGE